MRLPRNEFNTSWPGLILLLLGLHLLAGCATRLKINPAAELLPFQRAFTNATPVPAGPKLTLDYSQTQSAANRIADFMYFVPLISPELVSMVESTGNTQRAKVLSSKRTINRDAFAVTCEFAITGDGLQQNIFDQKAIIRRNEAKLKQGGTVEKQLAYINVKGRGHGRIVVEGTITNGLAVVNVVRLHFDGFGQATPVTIGLHDIRELNGETHFENEMVAQVEALTFKRVAGRPKMEVTVGSVKRKEAGDGLWQKFMGGVTGLAVNMFIKPLTVEAVGYRAMMDFGLALAAEKREFTFPRAQHLK